LPVFIARYAFSIAISFIVVFSLFWLMQYLIVSADRGLDEDDAGTMLDFVRIKPEEQVHRRPPKPDKPPPPEELWSMVIRAACFATPATTSASMS